jgi:hypothetical protein
MSYSTTLKRAPAGADESSVAHDRDAAGRAVEELVAHYESRARAVSRTAVAVGAVAGVLVGSVPLSPFRAAWPIPATYGFATVLGGLVVGVLIGFVIGDPRAKLYGRMADQARLQLQLEQRISQNDLRMAQLLTALTARAAAAAQRPAAAPAPAPAPAPPPPAPAAVPVIAPQPPTIAAAPAPEPPVVPAAPPRLRTVPPLSPPSAFDTSVS